MDKGFALMPYSSPNSYNDTSDEAGVPREVIQYQIDKPVVSQQCLDATKRVADEDFLYRFLYMTDPHSTFLRYYFMLSMTFSIVFPIARVFQSETSPNFMSQVRDILKPWHMTFEQWEHLLTLHPDHVGPELNAILNSIELPPPVKAKRMVEDLYYFYMICFLPGYLEFFDPGSSVTDLRVRSYRNLFLFIRGSGIPGEENLRSHMQRTLMGKPRVRTTTIDRMYDMELGAKRITQLFEPTEVDASGEPILEEEEPALQNVHVEYSTPESLSYYLATSYLMFMPSHGQVERDEVVQRDNTRQTNMQIDHYVRQSGSRSRPQS